MSLLSRIVLIVVIALLPAFGVELYNQTVLRDAQHAELKSEALRQGRAVAAELGRILDGTRNAMVALAALPAIQGEDGAACDPLLRSIRSRFAFIRVLALVGRSGRVVCSSEPSATRGELAEQWAHVRLARQRGHFAAAGYLFGSWTQAGLLATGMPVAPEAGGPDSGGPDGVLIADIGLDWLADQMAQIARQSGASITIADRRGIVLVDVPDGLAAGTALPPEARPWLVLAEPTLLSQPSENGSERPAAIVPFQDLVVAVRPDRSVAAQAQRAAGERSFVTFAAGLLMALAAATLLARRTVTEPVDRVLRAVARWQSGDHAARVEGRLPRGELGRIAGALNDLFAGFERGERGLRDAKAALETRVVERDRQLDAEVREREQAQALLQQAQKMEVIGQLTGGVAHDFNNLLTAIIGNLELGLLRSRDRPAVARLMANAMRAAERGASLTQRMLAFGRRQYLRLQPVDLAALLSGMEDLLTRTIGPTVTVTISVAPDAWLARADPNQLELVLLNLAINARDAMPAGGRLNIDIANDLVEGPGRDGTTHPARLEPGEYVRISLHDTGSGIDAETLARVLEPFFTTKPAGKGSGLGLSMAQGVAAQSGGGLAIESAVGLGTQVAVWFPRAGVEPVDAGPDVARELPAPTAEAPTAEARPGTSILLVDDDPEVGEVAEQCLAEGGYLVRRAETGTAALAIIESDAPVDLLIADLAMPEMNGLQLADRARARRPGLPVLLATGYADGSAVVGRAAPSANFPVLEKPFRATQLLDAVAALLDPREPRPGPGVAVP